MMPTHLTHCATALSALLFTLACTPEPPRAKLLLLISVDTLRADQLGTYGGDNEASPNLDALAGESVVFERAFAPAPFTRPSVAALLTGREPGQIGMLSNRARLGGDVPTLAEAFSNAGWATGAVVSNPVLKRHTGLARGFGVYDDATSDGESLDRVAVDTSAAAIVLLDALLAAPRAGVFLWVHYQDPHGPYTPPAGYRERFLAREGGRDDAARVLPVAAGPSGVGAIPDYQVQSDERSPAFYRAGYAGESFYVDREIGRLFSALRERGRYESATIAVTADHGEGLGEYEYWFAHGENLSEALLRVPLLLRAPGLNAQRRDDLASLKDVSTTLAAHFGLELGDGRDLLKPGAADSDAPVFVSTLGYVKPPLFGMLRTSFRYVIDRPGGAPRERLFALGGPERDVASEHPEAFEELRTSTREKIRQLRAAQPEVRAPSDAAERERLRALGYLDE